MSRIGVMDLGAATPLPSGAGNGWSAASPIIFVISSSL